jgi:menaquinone-dependent protoporphyrinogen oxidase
MSDKILVAYGSRYGSTKEVAEAIGKALIESGWDVDVQPAMKVSSIEAYGAVVLGAPLYMFAWLKDARQFLARHQAALVKRPVVIFALGPLNDNEKEKKEARQQLDKELAKFPWLTPVVIEVFTGKYDPAKLKFPLSLINLLPASPLKGIPASDARNWAAIGAWAKSLGEKLQPA